MTASFVGRLLEGFRGINDESRSLGDPLYRRRLGAILHRPAAAAAGQTEACATSDLPIGVLPAYTLGRVWAVLSRPADSTNIDPRISFRPPTENDGCWPGNLSTIHHFKVYVHGSRLTRGQHVISQPISSSVCYMSVMSPSAPRPDHNACWPEWLASLAWQTTCQSPRQTQSIAVKASCRCQLERGDSLGRYAVQEPEDQVLRPNT